MTTRDDARLALVETAPIPAALVVKMTLDRIHGHFYARAAALASAALASVDLDTPNGADWYTPMDVAAVLGMVDPIVAAGYLDDAHRAGLVHRSDVGSAYRPITSLR